MRTQPLVIFAIIVVVLLVGSALSSCDEGPPKMDPFVVAKGKEATATAEKAATETAEAVASIVKSAEVGIIRDKQADANSTLSAYLAADSDHRTVFDKQNAAAAANETLAAKRTAEAQTSTAVKLSGITATAQSVVVVTAQAVAQATQVKAQAVATSTAKAIKSELAEIQAQVAQAEKSLEQMESMGLSTDSIQAQLDTLKSQAESKAQSLGNSQAYGGLPGTWPGYGFSGTQTYVVQPGDTWFSISQRFGVPVGELAAVNGMSPYQGLPAGLVLTIPSYYPNPMPGPIPGPGSIYVVQPRDTMYSIARRFGVPLTELAAMNGIVVYNRIWVGQRLIIPSVGPIPPILPTYWPTSSIWPTLTPIWPTVAPIVTPTPIGGNDVYFSTDGKFSVQYPRSWGWGTNTPSGYVMFWTRKDRNNPYSAGFAIFSKASSVWRPARDILEDYENALNSSTSGLMASLWQGVSFAWDGDIQAYTLGGQLAMGELGYAQSNRVLARAAARNDGTREYMALAWSPSIEWDTNRSTLDALIDTLAFTN